MKRCADCRWLSNYERPELMSDYERMWGLCQKGMTNKSGCCIGFATKSRCEDCVYQELSEKTPRFCVFQLIKKGTCGGNYKRKWWKFWRPK